MAANFEQRALQIDTALTSALANSEQQRDIAIFNARGIDASGIHEGFWLVARNGRIEETGWNGVDTSTFTEENIAANTSHAFEAACKRAHISPEHRLDAQGKTLVPGYIDIHSHGGWGHAFDDSTPTDHTAFLTARACHLYNGTTRQVASLITNPIPKLEQNLEIVAQECARRPDVLGSHLEGPFISPLHKGAHDPACLLAPKPQVVDKLLEAAHGTLRQITLAPELEGGQEAVRRFAHAGVVSAIGHSDMDYEQAQEAIRGGARLLTHIFDAMNGLDHRNPGPIPAAVENPQMMIELINDGFHVQTPMVRLAFRLAPHRICLITDAMAATGCPDGPYKLGELDVTVVNSHARLVSNGAIAASTLTLAQAVKNAVAAGIPIVAAVEAATLSPARALGLDRANSVSEAPLGLLAPGFAADFNLCDNLLSVEKVWVAGIPVR